MSTAHVTCTLVYANMVAALSHCSTLLRDESVFGLLLDDPFLKIPQMVDVRLTSVATNELSANC